MIDRIILWITVRFIKANMGHERPQYRKAIFEAINEGVHESFSEDNVFTRMNWTVRMVTRHGKEFRECKSVKMLAQNASDAVEEENNNPWTKLMGCN